MTTACAHALVHAVVDGLELRHKNLQSKPARAYFRSGRGRDSTRRRVLRAFHESLADVAGMLGLIKKSRRAWMAEVDRDSLIAQVCDAWNGNVGHGTGTDFAILDLSVRLCGAALLWLGDAAAIVSTIASLEAASPLDWLPTARRLTHEGFAKLAGVSPRHVQRWLDGCSTPRNSRYRHIAKALKKARLVDDEHPVQEIEVGLWRWFAARALRRALVARVGASLADRLAIAVPLLVRTLVQHLVMHPADAEALRLGPDSGPFALLVYGMNSMSFEGALDVIQMHAPSPEWSDIAGTLFARVRKEREAPLMTHFRPPSPKSGPWDDRHFLESMRPLPTYGEVAAAWADLARRRGRRRAARRLAKQAAGRGESRALAVLETTKRRPRGLKR